MMYKQVVHSWMYGAHSLETVLDSMLRIGADGIDLALGVGPGLDYYLAMDIEGLVKSYGMSIPCVTIGYVEQKNDLSHSDEAVRAGAIEFTKRCIDVTAHAGCDRALVVPSWVAEEHVIYTTYEEDWKRAVDSIRQAGEYAQTKGVMLLVEPVNRYRVSLVRTVDEAAKMIKEIGLPNIYMVPDTFHMNIEDEDGIPRSLRRVGEYVQCLHIGDNTRRAPGHGVINWRDVIGALNDIGFDGPLSYEPVYNAYSAGRVSKDKKALSAFEAELKSGIQYLRDIMERTN